MADKKISKNIELKKKKVLELVALMEKSKTIGVINLANLPARQLKAVRSKLKDKVQFIFAKKTMIKRAMAASKKDAIKNLAPLLENIYPAIALSNMDAFELFSTLKASRQMVAAKPGQIAPYDIVIPAGPTPFTPGPALSELAQLNIKKKVEGGKIVITEDATVAEQGQAIQPLAASMLARLGVMPMQVGVTITNVLEDKDLYPGQILDIDTAKYTQDLKDAFLNAFSLALELGYASNETAEHLLQRAYRTAKGISLVAAITTPENAAETILLAQLQASKLQAQVNP